MKDFRLVKIKDTLKKEYFIDWHTNDILAVKVEKNDLPIAFIIANEHPEDLVLSVAFDGDAFITAHIAIKCSKHCTLTLGEGFFIDEDGRMLFGKDALEQLRSTTENTNLLELVTPISKAIH